MILLGIDPGLDGAASAHYGTTLRLLDTPTLTVQGKGGNKREYALAAMSLWLEERTKEDACHAFLELVHAMPGQGVRSMFSMGYGVGVWEGLLTAHGIAFTRVPPQRWKNAMLDGMGHDKDASRLRAMQLFPEHAQAFARKKDDGRAEAALIAEYGRRVLPARATEGT